MHLLIGYKSCSIVSLLAPNKFVLSKLSQSKKKMIFMPFWLNHFGCMLTAHWCHPLPGKDTNGIVFSVLISLANWPVSIFQMHWQRKDTFHFISSDVPFQTLLLKQSKCNYCLITKSEQIIIHPNTVFINKLKVQKHYEKKLLLLVEQKLKQQNCQ